MSSNLITCFNTYPDGYEYCRDEHMLCEIGDALVLDGADAAIPGTMLDPEIAEYTIACPAFTSVDEILIESGMDLERFDS